MGAGTGFLALLLARQGYEVTALDLSPGMLSRLQEKAGATGLAIRTIQGDAGSPPLDDFDAVVERHLLWTLPDPAAALEAWERSAPMGRLMLLESLWGKEAGPLEQVRRQCHALARHWRHEPPDHHREYGTDLRGQLPLGHGATPEQLVALVEASPWGDAHVQRLREVEWATRRSLPSAWDRLIGVAPRFAVLAR